MSNDWIYTYKGPKFSKCRIISLLEEYFLLLNTFYTFFVTCTNFKIYKYKSYFLLLLAFFMTFYICQKSVTRVATRGPPGLLSSRVAITSHQYTITLYTSGHLQISWDVFAKKSADILSFRISFITISTFYAHEWFWLILPQFQPMKFHLGWWFLEWRMCSISFSVQQ